MPEARWRIYIYIYTHLFVFFTNVHDTYKFRWSKIEDLEKNRLRKKKGFQWRQFLITTSLFAGLLYLLIHYSAEIEFKQSEATLDIKESTQSIGVGAGEEKESSSDEAGAASASENEGGNTGQGGQGVEVEVEEVEEKIDPLLTETGEEIEMVFDLSGEDALQTLQMLKGTESLSDSALLKRADEIRNESLSGKASYHKLQEGLALADFVLKRSIYNKKECLRQKCVQVSLSKKEQRDLERLSSKEIRRLRKECEECRQSTPSRVAQTMISGLSAKLREQCRRLYSQKVCEYKVRYPQWKHSTIQGIIDHQVLLGMTLEQAKESWGKEKEKLPEFGGGFSYCYDQDCTTSFKIQKGRVVAVHLPSLEEDPKKRGKGKRKRKSKGKKKGRSKGKKNK